MSKLQLKNLFAYFFLIISIACSSIQSVGDSPTMTLEPSITPSATFARRPKVSTLTRAPTLTRTPSLTPTLTLTAWPTYPPNEALAIVLELFETNGGCQLPCWWRIVPGETRWDDTGNFLSAVAVRINGVSKSQGVFSAFFPVTEFMSSDRMFKVQFNIKNNIIVAIHVGGSDININSPQSILSSFGQPDEVWISTSRSAYGNPDLPFIFVLYYSSKGLYVAAAVDGGVVGEIVRGCPHQATGSALGLLPPREGLTFAEASDRTIFFGESASDFKPLQDVTELTVEEFYLRYREEGPQECLETPRDNWE